jgi:hypothetical protein
MDAIDSIDGWMVDLRACHTTCARAARPARVPHDLRRRLRLAQSAHFGSRDRFRRWIPSRDIGFRNKMAGTKLLAKSYPKEKPMTESQKLSVLRDKLIRRRRALVEVFQNAATDQRLNGDDLVRVQNEIEAVERAMAEEKRAEFRL